MDKITLCNPDARILKHMNISIGKIEREAGRFVGMYLPNGYKFENHFDVINFACTCANEHITFGSGYCNNRENITGCCKGHLLGEFSAPCDFKIVVSKDSEIDYLKEIENTRFGLIPLASFPEIEKAKEGDYITLENAEKTKGLKLVITCYRKYIFSGKMDEIVNRYVGVALVMQREKPNGKIQYFI